MLPIFSKIIVKPLEYFYREFPPTVRIESTNMCNADCVTCPREEMTRKPGTMEMDLYEKIIRECSRYKIRCLHLHNFGEPLLDKLLSERIRIAKKAGLKRVKIISNGSLLTEEKTRELIESGLDELKISIDGHSPETFEKIRKKLKYADVVENIRQFIKIRDGQGSATPRLTLNFVRSKDNQSEEKAFIQYWRGKVDSISIDKVHNWGIQYLNPLKKSVIRKPCLRVWNTFTVLWNGDVALCCLDYDGKVILGNLEQESFQDIWQGEKLRRIRQYHIQADLSQIPICENCSKSML